MVRHDEDVTQSPGTVYTLYIEYLGGLVSQTIQFSTPIYMFVCVQESKFPGTNTQGETNLKASPGIYNL